MIAVEVFATPGETHSPSLPEARSVNAVQPNLRRTHLPR